MAPFVTSDWGFFVTSRCVSMATNALESPVQCGVRVGTSVAVGVLCVYVSFVCLFHADNERCRETAPGAASSPLGLLPCRYISMFTCALSFLIQQCGRPERLACRGREFSGKALDTGTGQFGYFCCCLCTSWHFPDIHPTIFLEGR